VVGCDQGFYLFDQLRRPPWGPKTWHTLFMGQNMGQNKKIKAAIWARVSTGDQETANQVAELREWAANRGFDVVVEYVLEESAYKGKHRDDLNQALEDARLGRYDVLLCWALDRMERGGVEATLGLLRRFRERGVVVWSMKESWTETSDPRMAELLGAIYAWMAAEESRRRSERVKAGLERRRREGKPVGRQLRAKDKTQRRRSGYVARWERTRSA
jgi:putative DNA-invertase from lambdoid prophage Rac